MGYSVGLFPVHWNKTDPCHCKGREFTVEYPLEVNMLRSSATRLCIREEKGIVAQVTILWLKAAEAPRGPRAHVARWPLVRMPGCTLVLCAGCALVPTVHSEVMGMAAFTCTPPTSLPIVKYACSFSLSL